MAGISIAPVAQWQSRGLIIPWLQVRVLPGALFLSTTQQNHQPNRPTNMNPTKPTKTAKTAKTTLPLPESVPIRSSAGHPICKNCMYSKRSPTEWCYMFATDKFAGNCAQFKADVPDLMPRPDRESVAERLIEEVERRTGQRFEDNGGDNLVMTTLLGAVARTMGKPARVDYADNPDTDMVLGMYIKEMNTPAGQAKKAQSSLFSQLLVAGFSPDAIVSMQGRHQ